MSGDGPSFDEDAPLEEPEGSALERWYATGPVVCERRWTAQVYAVLGVVFALYSFVHPFPKGHDFLLALGCSMQLASRMPWLLSTWGMVETLRSKVYVIVSIFPALVLRPIVEQDRLAFLGVAVAMAAIVVVWERTQTLAFDAEGLEYRAWLPWPRTVRIPYRDVRTVTSDERHVTVKDKEGRATHTYTEWRLRFADGRRAVALSDIVWDTGHELEMALAAAQPHAAGWTLRRWREQGRVRLGPVEIRKDSIAFSRHASRFVPTPVHVFFAAFTWYFTGWLYLACWMAVVAWRTLRGWRVIPFERLEVLRIADGELELRATGEGEATGIPLRRVPNGLWLPDLVAALRAHFDVEAAA